MAADAIRLAFSDCGDLAAGDADAACVIFRAANSGNCIRDSFYGAAGDFYRCRQTKADTTAISVGIRFYVTAVDGDVGIIETPNPISVSIFANASSCRYIAAVDGDAAAAPRTNRICGSISHDRAAIDGNTATVTEWAGPDPNIAGSSMHCYRFGADNAAIDGNAAALPLSGRL